jgi:predicted RNase H-like HicB family nuclease
MVETTPLAQQKADMAAEGIGIIPITLNVGLPARIHRDDDGAIWADVPALPGCIAGGETLDEVLTNLREAAEGWLLAKQDLETKGWPDR